MPDNEITNAQTEEKEEQGAAKEVKSVDEMSDRVGSEKVTESSASESSLEELKEKEGEEVQKLEETKVEESPEVLPEEGSGSTPAVEAVEIKEAKTEEPEISETNIQEPPVIVKEIIKEVPQEITPAEKEQIFKDKLTELAKQAVIAKQKKHQANLNKILEHLKTTSYVANDEVEQICEVANSTAAKYLAELENQGLIIQIGSAGRNVRYRLRQAI